MRSSTVFAAILTAALAGVHAQHAAAQDSPPASAAGQPGPPAGFTEDVVKAKLATMLPGDWRLDSFDQQAAVNTGTVAGPTIRTRFEAHVSLETDTYARDGNDGPVVFVRKVAPAGMQKVLYGLSTSTLSGGAWQTQLDLQNPDVLQGVGESLATIPGRVIVRGSPEEASFLKERDAERAQAAQEQMAEAKRQADLAAQRRAADEAAAAAQRQQAEATAVAEAQRQAAVAAVQAETKRQQAQLDAEAVANLAQTKAAGEQALAAQQKDLLTAQEAALQARTRLLEELRVALQSQARSERLGALDTALTSNDLTVRSLGFDTAFEGQDPAAQNIALRRFFYQKRSIIFSLFAPKEWKQGQQPPNNVIAALGAVHLDIKEFDLASGRFSGNLLFGSDLQWEAAGTIDRDMVNIAARGAGKPVHISGAALSLSIVLQLSPEKELDGFAQLGGAPDDTTYSPVIVRVNLD